jgi:hypothetical protein
MIDGLFDMWKDLIGASHIDDGLGTVSSFSPVALIGTVLLGIAFCLRLFSSHDLASIFSHDYAPHCLFPCRVVVFGQLRDVAVSALENFGRHCMEGLCFSMLRRSCKSRRTQDSGYLVIAGGWRFWGSC